jgi:hypothetical protein
MKKKLIIKHYFSNYFGLTDEAHATIVTTVAYDGDKVAWSTTESVESWRESRENDHV